MSILKCRYCGFVTESFLCEDATFMCEECSEKLSNHKKPYRAMIDDSCEVNITWKDEKMEVTKN